MRPYADDFDCFDVIQDLIDEPVLDIDPAGTGPGQIAKKFFVRGRRAIGVFLKKFQQALGLRFKARCPCHPTQTSATDGRDFTNS